MYKTALENSRSFFKNISRSSSGLLSPSGLVKAADGNYGYAADGSSLNPADMGGVSMPLDGSGGIGSEAVAVGAPELQGTEGGYEGA